MKFPEEKDINRLINLVDAEKGDFGFLVVIIFSFIEKYMKNEISLAIDQKGYSEYKFRPLVEDYLSYVKNIYNTYDYTNDNRTVYSNLIFTKTKADDVRHNFATKSLEDVLHSIQLLNKFFQENDKNIRSQLTPLDKMLNKWRNRTYPEDAKSFEEAIASLGLLSKNVPTIILEMDEYNRKLHDIDELRNSLELLKTQLNEKESNEEEYETKIKQLQQEEKDLQEKYAKHQKYIDFQEQLISYSRTRTDFEKSISQLTSEQENAVNRISFTGDYLIKGSAGTGKSLVLLKTIEKLIKGDGCNNELLENKDRIYFLTYTNSLVNYNKYIAALLNMGIKPENITTADIFFGKILEKYTKLKNIDYSTTQYSSLKKKIRDIINCRYQTEDISEEDVYNEVIKFVWPNAITRKEYLDNKVTRKGMNRRLSMKQREIYWNIIYELNSLLKKENKWIVEYAIYNIALKFKDIPLTEEEKISEYVFVDESQDLSVAALLCIKAVTKKSIVMARDIDQTINQIPLIYSNSGMNVIGNSISLNTNFRNTVQINNVTEKYRKLIPGAASNTNMAFRLGVPVELFDLSSENSGNIDLNQIVLSKINFLSNELKYALENICIIFSESSTARIDKMIKFLATNNLMAENIKDKDFNSSKKISISTIQSCKGLDFPAVILIADNFSSFEFKTYDEEVSEKIQRNKLYVACTRAMDSLTVITGKCCDNKAIQSLKECILEINNK